MKHPRDHFAPRSFGDPTNQPRAIVLTAAEIETITAPPKITVATQPTLSVTLWRCALCGKWSHAKRRPKAHFPLKPLGESEAVWEPRRCGPFEKWEAWKVESG